MSNKVKELKERMDAAIYWADHYQNSKAIKLLIKTLGEAIQELDLANAKLAPVQEEE